MNRSYSSDVLFVPVILMFAFNMHAAEIMNKSFNGEEGLTGSTDTKTPAHTERYTHKQDFPSPVSFKSLNPGGELLKRLHKNFDRLEEEKYQPEHLFLTNEQSHWWPGDTEGRTILALSLLSQSTHREAKYLDEIIKLLPSKLNSLGYFGDIAPGGILDEQQLSSHGWVLRGLCEYYEWKQDTSVLTAIRTIVQNLAYPTIGKHVCCYPVEPDKRNAEGSFIGKRGIKQVNNWILSTDIGCDFIFLDGLVHAYQLLREDSLKVLIEEMADVFIKLNLVEINAQTHASLTAMRALLRYYEISGNQKILEAVAQKFEIYKQYGMTANYENYNWFGRPSHSEPCAIHDSYIVALNLWRFTRKSIYIEDAQHIYFNAICAAQRDNGGFGCNSCSGTDDPFLYERVNEAHWCCTMRGGEGLSRAAQYSYFTRGNSIYIINPSGSSVSIQLNGEEISLRQSSDYPFKGNINLEVTGCSYTEPVKLNLFSPSYTSGYRIFINNDEIKPETQDGFLVINRLLKKGDIIKVVFEMNTGFSVTGIAADMKGYQTVYYGPLLLASADGAKSEVTLNANNKAKYVKDDLFYHGNTELVPIYNLMEKFTVKQVLFKVSE